MFWLGVFGAALLLLLPLIRSVRGATRLFVVKVRAGQAHFVQGRIPHGLLADIADVVRSSHIEHAEVRAVRRSGRAEVYFVGVVRPEDQQRLRNAVGCYSLQRISAGARPSRRKPPNR
jgi:Protein of unknown function (DUF3634)